MHHIKGSNVYRMDNMKNDKYKMIIKKEETGKLKISISVEGVKINETEREIKKEELKDEINKFQKMLNKEIEEIYKKSEKENKNKINIEDMNMDLI